jgi:ATP-dependent DNA ligase
MILPILYSKSKNGKIVEWSIKIQKEDNYSDIIISSGYTDGKKTIHTTKIDKGKNIGKKNETSHFEQAISEAQSKWNLKKKKCVENIVDTNIIQIKPMLAHKYRDYKNKIKFPAYFQNKLDGYRGICVESKDELKGRVLTMRTSGDIIQNIPHITEFLNSLNLPDNIILDGELYMHGVSTEDLGGLRRIKAKTKNKSEAPTYEYHIYDLIDINNTDLVFAERNKLINNIQEKLQEKINSSIVSPLKFVKTTIVNSYEEIDNLFKKALDDGYEGGIIRNDTKYEIAHRSYNLLKYKIDQDEEFKIIGFEEEKDSLSNDKMIIFVVEVPTENGFVKCKVTSKGTKEERKEVLIDIKEHPENWINKMLSVQYFSKNKYGNLVFPKTLRTAKTSVREIE